MNNQLSITEILTAKMMGAKMLYQDTDSVCESMLDEVWFEFDGLSLGYPMGAESVSNVLCDTVHDTRGMNYG